MTAKCLDRETLTALINDTLPETIRLETISHLDQCRDCQSKIEQIAGDADNFVHGIENLDPSEQLSKVMADLTGEYSEPVRDGDHYLQSLNYAFEPSGQPNGIGKFADHEIEGFLGAGGMGIVLKAFDDSLQRHVAIKLLPPNAATNQESRFRFLREARAAASIDHENVVTIHAVDEFNGIPYLIMQYVNGESLYLLLQKKKKLDTGELIQFATQVASGLAEAHRRGIIHRDIKPANILIEQETGKALVTDFGLAQTVHEDRLTQSGYAAGTPCFMSPEQAKAEPLDARSDLFSFGAVLYTAATGDVPFEGDSIYAVIRHVCESSPTPVSERNPAVPVWLSQAIEKLMMKDPSQRFQSAKSFSEELKSKSREAIPVHTQDADVTDEAPTPEKRNSIGIGIGLALFFVALVLGIVYWNSDREKLPEKDGQSIANSASTDENTSGPFRLVGSSASFDTLSEAIAAAQDGATIEVTGDGPYEISRCEINKSISIRAAKNASPILTQRENETGPVIIAQQGLTLAGLSMGYSQMPPSSAATRYRAESSFLAIHGGDLLIDNCDFRCLKGGIVVYFAGDQGILKNSRFWNGFDMAVSWACQRNSSLSIQESFLDTHLGVTILAALNEPARNFNFEMKNSIFRNQTGFNFHPIARPETAGVEIPDHDPFVFVDARNNLFHISSLVNFRASTAATDGRAKKQLKYLLDWHGKQNAFSSFNCLSSVSRLRLQRYRAVHQSFADWIEDWHENESAVVAGEFTALTNNNRPPKFTVSEWLEGKPIENLGWQDSVVFAGRAEEVE